VLEDREEKRGGNLYNIDLEKDINGCLKYRERNLLVSIVHKMAMMKTIVGNYIQN